MRILKSLREITQYPSAVIGLIIILGLIVVSIVTLFAIPYEEAVRLWRGGEEIWYNSPKTASPKWTNWFRAEKLPETITLGTANGEVEKTYEKGENSTKIHFSYIFDFEYDDFPDELTLYFDAQFKEKLPHVEITWHTPDEREIRVASFAPERKDSYRVSQDEKLTRRLGRVYPQIGLFADPDSDPENPVPLKGTYEMRVAALNGDVLQIENPTWSAWTQWSDPVTVDTGADPISSISVYTSIGGIEIQEGVAQSDNTPYVLWSVAESISPVVGFSTQLNGPPDCIPDSSSTSVTLEPLPEGSTIFHVRAIDAAGNCGPDSSFEIVVSRAAEIFADGFEDIPDET